MQKVPNHINEARLEYFKKEIHKPNPWAMLESSAHDMTEDLLNDLNSVLDKYTELEINVDKFTFPGEVAQNVVNIQGKIEVNVQNKSRFVNYKIILPSVYPHKVPFVYLDEPINKEVIEMIDYLEDQNRIQFQYLIMWKNHSNIDTVRQTYNLVILIQRLDEIFKKMPPVSMEELFGPSDDVHVSA